MYISRFICCFNIFVVVICMHMLWMWNRICNIVWFYMNNQHLCDTNGMSLSLRRDKIFFVLYCDDILFFKILVITKMLFLVFVKSYYNLVYKANIYILLWNYSRKSWMLSICQRNIYHTDMHFFSFIVLQCICFI